MADGAAAGAAEAALIRRRHVIYVEGYDPQEVAATLDASYRIQVRPGFHCAPLMHESLGTANTGGTVRLSLGVFNTTAEIDATVAAVAEIASAAVSFS